MSDLEINISKNKQSLEYIPCPCLKSHKIKIMRKLIGRSAELMYFDLLKFIGSQKHCGYWIQWNKDAQNVFLLEYDYTKDELKEYLDYYFEENIFSKEIFEKYNIITGEEIQQYWLICAKKRMRFIEGIIEPFMLVSYQKEVEENQKRFAKFLKLASENSNFLTSDSSEEVNQAELNSLESIDLSKLNVPLCGTPHKPLTSSSIQHSKAVSKSVAKSNSCSNKQDYIHPTDVVNTFENFSSTGDIINSISSDLLLSGFEAKKNESNQNSAQITQTNKNVSPPGESAKPKKMPHPAREHIISIWEKGNKLKYVQNKENNMAIPPLIRKLEGLLDLEGNVVSDANIIQKFTWLWTNKGILSEFLQKQYRNFTSLEKYFNEIVGEIRDNSQKNHAKQNQAVRQPAYMRLISEMI